MTLAFFGTPARRCRRSALVGLIGSKAIVAINGGAPRTLAPGGVLLRRMRFLNRMEMKRGDQSMTLTKRD